MEVVNVSGSVTRFKGSPVEVRALLQGREDGGIEVSILDSVLHWEVPAESVTAFAPFFSAKERRLDVDRATDPNKTVLNFHYVSDDGEKTTASVVVTRGQLVRIG